jgi:hypothetical protein
MTNHDHETQGRSKAGVPAASSEPAGSDREHAQRDRTAHDAREHTHGPTPETRLVQPGWLVRSWAGDRIGTVIEINSDSLLVRLNSIDAREIRVPVTLVSGADEAESVATLSVEANELEAVEIRTEQLDLLGDSA